MVGVGRGGQTKLMVPTFLFFSFFCGKLRPFYSPFFSPPWVETPPRPQIFPHEGRGKKVALHLIVFGKRGGGGGGGPLLQGYIVISVFGQN